MMNRSLFGLALLTAFSYVTADQQGPIQLNPIIIGLVDGLSFGIHGEMIGAIYKIARDVQALQIGRRTEQGRLGILRFEGNEHTIRSLAEREKLIARQIEQTDQGMRTQLLNQQIALKDLLKNAKQKFAEIVAPFLAHARGAKEPMFMLISESCSKRDRVNSLLFNWAKSNEDEIISFDKAVTSFSLFDEFCTDLIDFLGDLIQSCPKARAQFEQLKQDYLRKRAA